MPNWDGKNIFLFALMLEEWMQKNLAADLADGRWYEEFNTLDLRRFAQSAAKMSFSLPLMLEEWMQKNLAADLAPVKY